MRTKRTEAYKEALRIRERPLYKLLRGRLGQYRGAKEAVEAVRMWEALLLTLRVTGTEKQKCET
jgi:hypothetical protein